MKGRGGSRREDRRKGRREREGEEEKETEKETQDGKGIKAFFIFCLKNPIRQAR